MGQVSEVASSGWKTLASPARSVESCSNLPEPSIYEHMPQPVWTGDDLNHSPSALALLESAPDFAMTDELLRFFEGDQWDPDERKRREEQGRPVLTVNMLPRIFAVAMDAQRITDDPDSADVCSGHKKLKCWIARRNRDAQILYNYAVSAAAERMAAQRDAAMAAIDYYLKQPKVNL